MREFRRLLISLGMSAIWPAYLGLVAYAARQAPWPRPLALLSAWVLAGLSLVILAGNLARWLFRPGGWAEERWQFPPDVARQLLRSALILLAASVVFLIPHSVFSRGVLAPEGRPISAPSFCRGLNLAFEVTVWGVILGLVRRRSPLLQWVQQLPDRLGWVGRRRRVLAGLALGPVGAIIALDARGYSFTAQRMAVGACQSLVVIGLCCGLFQLILHVINLHAWRWIRPLRTDSGATLPDGSAEPDDLADRLRRLAGLLVPAVAILLLAWVWNVDLALFQDIGKLQLWTSGAGENAVPVTVGDLSKAVVVLLLSVAAWHHMSTFLAVTVFPRMPDDPGVRFAIVTLGRYAVVAVGLLVGLSAVHLGLEKISMLLAALGVGLGFGLQEIVSNFVCGIILLLERPIRIGDVVTVAGTTGKVDRINIRATTIINWDNQSMIVPNREFITGNLVNWTHKDKILRVTVKVSVAFGVDPDRVTDLLLALAQDDPDVLCNPVPAALMEGFGDSTLNFQLAVFVPDPSLIGRVRHRLCARIQDQFQHAGIALPYPSRELHLRSVPANSTLSAQAHLEFFRQDGSSPTRPALTSPEEIDPSRQDGSSPTPPAHHLGVHANAPLPATPCHRGVDE